MKSSLSFIFWFVVTFVGISIIMSVGAAEPPRLPPPPAECSCGVCEDKQ